MQDKQKLVEEAYIFLCKKKKTTFNEIWIYIKKKFNISKEDEEKIAGELYIGIILNPNFFLKNDKFWYPRNKISLEEIKKHMIRVKDPNNINEEINNNNEKFINNNENINLNEDEDNDSEIVENIQSLEDIYDD